MCNALTESQKQLETTLSEIDGDTVTLEELQSLGKEAAAYTVGLTKIGFVDEEEREELELRRHSIEHFFAALGNAMSKSVMAKHSSIVEFVEESTLEGEEEAKMMAEQQDIFNQYQYGLRIKHAAFARSLIDNTAPEDTMEVFDVYGRLVGQMMVREQMSALSEGGIEKLLSEAIAGDMEAEGQPSVH